ncbi:CDP-glucose 4,6-dehydratase, partial [bacterium]|nr:CDP-glucose 4,6-dehydratase [bacterium]
GDWGQDRLIPDCIKKWLNKDTVFLRYPQAIRPWQHVLEPLSGYLMLAEKLYQEGTSFSEAWNFGPNDVDAKPVQFVVERLAALWGKDATWKIDPADHPHEAHYLKLDCSKAKARLGWTPKWELGQTLEKIVSWYQIYQKTPNQIKKETLEQIDFYSR